MLLFQLQDFLSRYGISTDAVRSGDMADIGSALRPVTEKERGLIEQRIQQLYDEFIGRTAVARGLSEEDVRKLAEGRIFSGRDAAACRLVDRLGGLSQAIELAAEAAGARCRRGQPKIRVSFGPHIKQPFIVRMLKDKAEQGMVAGQSLPLTAGDAGLVPVAVACRSLQAQPLLIEPLLAGLMSPFG